MELIIAELRAAVGMTVGIDAVDVIRLIDLRCRFNGPGNIINTADGRDNPTSLRIPAWPSVRLYPRNSYFFSLSFGGR